MTCCQNWVGTLNNYSIQEKEALEQFECVYKIIGKEKGKEGTPHLQMYFWFKTKKSLAQMKKLSIRAHWEPAKGDAQSNYDYCSKDGDFVETGVRPMSQKRKGELGKQSIEERWKLAKLGSFELLPPEQIKTYQYIFSKYQTVTDRPVLDNVWIYGASGAGKSRYVRDTYPQFYSKPMSKWWDGYVNEDVVVLDDFAPEHGKFLGYFLKIWADHYAFNAEVKGGMLKIRPKIIIVTSQYNIETCFEESETISAIRRRFVIKQM